MRFLAVALLALVFAAPALADQTYNDATGEDANSADISTVAVANNPTAGTVTFNVTTANMPTFEANANFLVLIDSDRNVSTGDPNGFDYVFIADNTGSGLGKWNGSTFAPAGNTQSSFANGVWTGTANAVDLGGPTAFDFAVATLRGPDPNNPAEDDTPVFTYTMVAPPPPPPPPPPAPAPVTVSSVAAVFHGVPTHGKVFRVTGLTVDLSNGVETKSTALSCTATLGGKAIKGSGAGHCTFKLPATAKGKRFVVKVHGKYKAASLVKTYTLKVK